MDSNDALSLLGKFHEEDIPLVSTGIFLGVSFMLRGKVSEIEKETGAVVIASLENECVLRLKLLADGLMFGYSQMKSAETVRAMGLTIDFPPRESFSVFERVSILEIPPT